MTYYSSKPNVQNIPKPPADLRELADAAIKKFEARVAPNDDLAVLADILLQDGAIEPYKKPPGAGGGAANAARFRRYGLAHAQQQALDWARRRFGAGRRWLNTEGVFDIQVVDARITDGQRGTIAIVEFRPVTWSPLSSSGIEFPVVPVPQGLALGQVHTWMRKLDEFAREDSFVQRTFLPGDRPSALIFDRDRAMALTRVRARNLRLKMGRELLVLDWSH